MASGCLIDKIKKMNNEFELLSERNNYLIEQINVEIMHRDIKKYLDDNDIYYKYDNHFFYLDKAHNKRIRIDDWSMLFSFRNLEVSESFNICLDEFSTFNNHFKVGNRVISLNENGIFTTENEVIEKIIIEYEQIINNLKRNIQYIENNIDIEKYTYYYEEYYCLGQANNNKYFSIEELINCIGGYYKNFKI
ncbi:hypothetical protein [Tepidibacter hydrothermalis]|uniref:Uncharacterized protein n=1 Tax=Tepidibacter hydrothermalis TaxID=3036126 RepID=A0ABY8EAC6_9FIRM|nr:hypothetical protein [Tepidibacter hydrothermalis]WFD08759.1 hypothetical protein P4S50_10150 [Tepidibacter hydrothermalis]